MTSPQGQDRWRRVIWTSAISGVGIGFALVAFLNVRNQMTLNKVEQANADLKMITVAMMSIHVDDCGDSNPDAGNRIPAKLTTPVAYLKSFPQDPFSPRGETYRFLNQRYRMNASYFIVVSRGPDGIWDIDRLPCREKAPAPIRLPKQTQSYKRTDSTVLSPIDIGAWETLQSYVFQSWTQEVEFCETSDGRIVNPLIDMIYLPGSGKNSNSMGEWFSKEKFIPYFLENNAPIYDPTNGARSKGDILFFSR